MEARKNLPSRYPFSGKPLEAEPHQNERGNNKAAVMGSRKEELQLKRNKGNS